MVQTELKSSSSIGGRGRRCTCPPPQKLQKKYFSGKHQVKSRNFVTFSGFYHVKFGHFVNFSYTYFWTKCRFPPELSELLCLCKK